MKRIRTGFRLAKDSFALLRRDRTLTIFPLLSAAFVAVVLALTLTPGLIWAAAADKDWIVLPFMVVGAFGATYFVVYFNVALAGAARLSMDGRDTSVAEGLAVARQRRGLILKWALVQFAVGGIAAVLRYVAGDSVAGRLVALVSSVVSAAWSVATFFVIPLLALEGLGPGDALQRSVSLVRERWGEGLVGSAAIGLAVLLVAVLPLAFFLQVTLAVIDANVMAGRVVFALWFLVVIVACTMASALGVIFRVELYRYSTEGRMTEAFAREDVIAAFLPPRRTRGQPAS